MPHQLCTKDRNALVVCDMQPDLLASIPLVPRESLFAGIKLALEAARSAKWLVVFVGLRFQSGYACVNPKHKLFGGFRRLNAKVGDKSAHWFMDGFSGAEIDPSLFVKGDLIVWRQQHLPGGELCELLRGEGVTKVALAGIKAGYAVQATCQVLCDNGLQVSVIRDCVQDDIPQRLAAVLDNLLPIYADVISLTQMIDDMIGMDEFVDHIDEQSRQALIGIVSVVAAATATATAAGGSSGCGDSGGGGNGASSEPDIFFYCTDCGREGHGKRYIQFLLERPGWAAYPTQVWYGRGGKEYQCPLGKKVVDFADEPEFSELAMYLGGREWLDEKHKVALIAEGFVPATFCLEKGNWVGGRQPPEDTADGATAAPWFVKQVDKNFGASIRVCSKPSEVVGLASTDASYVVQQHVRDPLLTDDGKKAHIKFYVLLICEADGVTWSLFTYKSACLSIAPTEWDPNDVSTDTQVTISRHPVPAGEAEGWKQHWPATYPKCRDGTAAVIKRAVEDGRLKGRLGKRQFEVFSAGCRHA
jgi:nicotinamidase-related amidase